MYIYITLCNPSEKLAKDNQYSREIRRNKPTWNGEQTVDISHNVRLAHGSVHTIHDNADRITESAKSGSEVVV